MQRSEHSNHLNNMPKQLMSNQCTPLHFLYGPSDCCLCGARMERDLLKEDIKFLLQFVDEDLVDSRQIISFKERMEQIRRKLR